MNVTGQAPRFDLNATAPRKNWGTDSTTRARYFGRLFDRRQDPAKILDQRFLDLVERTRSTSRLPFTCVSRHLKGPQMYCCPPESSVLDGVVVGTGFYNQEFPVTTHFQVSVALRMKIRM